jgi:hypothetical protein
MSKLMMCDNLIVTIAAQTKTTWIGYNALTEEFVEIPKRSSKEIPGDVVLRLLKDEKARIRLAYTLSEYVLTNTAQMLNVSVRQLYRLRAEHKVL